MLIVSPLSVLVSKTKSFTLNLNGYRNTHFQVLNKAKQNYKAIMSVKLSKLPCMERLTIEYTLYQKTKRKCDISNILSIHDKFFCDALVELGKLPDDNYDYLPEVNYKWGGIDKENPRVEVKINGN